jgi:RNA polymerase sigma factor (sigma-70 family)
MSEAAAFPSHGHIPVAGLRLLGDDRLARRAAEGDGQAFAALYQRHHQALYRYCRAILGNSEDAADALQNTMMAALRSLPGEQREIRLKPWLYRIAHNESISLLRRRPPHAGLEEASNVAAPRGSDPATRERLRQLVADLRELPDRQRAALVMRELSGLDYSEIGAALGSSPGATKQTVYEARASLHEMADGRDMSCDSVRRSLSADDRRKLRGRKLRAHLKACGGCRDFQAMMDVRHRDLAAVAPPLPAIAAAALLHGLGGGGNGGLAAGLAGLASSGTGKAVATSAVAKGLTAVAVVATVSAGTAGLTGQLPGTRGHETPRKAAGAAGAKGSVPGAHRPGAVSPGASQGHRAGAANRSKALLERHANGSHRPTHGPGAALHRHHAARTPRGSRPAVTPHRSGSRPSVHPLPRGNRAGAVSGGDKTVTSTPGATVPAPTGKPSGPYDRAPSPTELP